MSSISAASESLGNSEDDQDVLDYSPRAAGHNSQPLEEVLSGIGEILQDDDEILDQIKLIEKKSSSITANSEELDADELRVFPEKARSSKKKRFGLSEVKARSRSFDESVSLLMRNNRIILRNLRLFETNEVKGIILFFVSHPGKMFLIQF